jgi:hypothetical protein
MAVLAIASAVVIAALASNSKGEATKVAAVLAVVCKALASKSITPGVD